MYCHQRCLHYVAVDEASEPFAEYQGIRTSVRMVFVMFSLYLNSQCFGLLRKTTILDSEFCPCNVALANFFTCFESTAHSHTRSSAGGVVATVVACYKTNRFSVTGFRDLYNFWLRVITWMNIVLKAYMKY